MTYMLEYPPRAQLGWERLGPTSIGMSKGSGLLISAGATVTILSIKGSGIVSCLRVADNALTYPKVVIDGVTQPAPLDGTSAPITSADCLSTYTTKVSFRIPSARFKSSFTWTEYNSDTAGHYIQYIYAYSLFGSEVIKEEIEEDTKREQLLSTQ